MDIEDIRDEIREKGTGLILDGDDIKESGIRYNLADKDDAIFDNEKYIIVKMIYEEKIIQRKREVIEIEIINLKKFNDKLKKIGE